MPKSPVGGKFGIKPETLPFQPIKVAVLFGNGGQWSNPLLVAVEHVHEALDVVAVAEAGLLFAEFQAGDGAGIVRERAAQDIRPVGGFLGGGALDVLPHPVADLAVGQGFFHDGDELFMRHAGGLEPEAVKGFAEVFLVIGMQLAGEVQADLVHIARQVMPAVHGFARAAGIDGVAHNIMRGMVKALNRIVKFEMPRIFSGMKRMKYDFDVAVIGGGSGGYAAARSAVAAGRKTVVIEGGREVGGLCILRGCMPTKALLYAAEVKHLAEHAATWGLRAGKVSFDFTQVMARKAEQIKDFAGFREQQLNAGKFKFIRAQARFLDAHTVALANLAAAGPPAPKPGGKLLTAKHFIIATGSTVSPSPLPQLDDVGYLTSDDAVALKRLPRSLIILGGGAIACEFAQIFVRFGVQVTLIQRSERLLKEFDADAGAVVATVFRREGMQVFTGTQLVAAVRRGKLKTVSFQHQGQRQTVAAEEILFALGRMPNTASLGLEYAGVTTKHGRVVTNDRMQTSTPHIFAAGDCTGPHEIVHIAIQQGEAAVQNLVHPREPRRMDYRLLLSVVFTDPQVACVGLTEQAATARGIKFLAASYPFNDHGKSLLMEAKDGFVKLLANPKTGEIIGGACVGPAGGELIHEIVTAMAKRMTVHELAAVPHYHPTLAEIWTYPAEELAEKIKCV